MVDSSGVYRCFLDEIVYFVLRYTDYCCECKQKTRLMAPSQGKQGGGGSSSSRDSEMERLAKAEAEFRFAVQREQAALMASGLGRTEVGSLTRKYMSKPHQNILKILRVKKQQSLSAAVQLHVVASKGSCGQRRQVWLHHMQTRLYSSSSM